MTSILAIDPGSTESGWVLYLPVPQKPIKFGKADNEAVLELVEGMPYNVLVVEMIENYGRGADSLYETSYWVGRYIECARTRNLPGHRLYRREVKQHLCGKHAGVTDADVWQATLKLYGGEKMAMGTKAAPGLLHGVKGNDVKAALALARAWADNNCGGFEL